MKIVYMHMHLKPGGVSTVISQQVRALSDHCRVLVATGDDPPVDFPAPCVKIAGLGYDDPDFPEKDPPPYQTAKAVAAAIYDRWPEGCDIIHVHNPLIGKNSRLLAILDHLKAMGFPLFLQIHDFPEDGRPGSYYLSQDYPSDCHYGAINARDCRFLETSGLAPEGVHKLFNMVSPIDTRDLQGEALPSVLYPVRGIRRKNIGEALLLSLYFPADTPLAVTLPPNSAVDWIVYKEWIAYAGEKGLNVLFEASSHYDFRALVANARYLITTSITEGFGFAFLEPWTAGKTLMGRKLPDICRDFEQKGIALEHLYESLPVPEEWIDRGAFERQLKQCLQDTFARYGAALNESGVSEGFERLIEKKMVDFSVLNEPLQRKVLDRLIGDQSAYRSLERLNPVLAGFRTMPDFSHVVSSNRHVIQEQYNEKKYRDRLMDTYMKVLHTPVRHKIDKSVLLRQFLCPDNFSLMKWCDHDLS
ncbi:MAG: hypothetical protein R6T92_06265 [Desulfosalsimonadaceae bacterium]